MMIKRSKPAVERVLPFEKKLSELQEQLDQAESDEDRERLSQEIEKEREAVYAHLTPWQRVQLARHQQRPRMLDFTARILDDFMELHGDRAVGDDPAMVCGIGRFHGESVAVVGQQKGVTTDEKVKCNFGMAHPEGYRKALRVFKLAERLKLPILTFVDTPAAHPGIEAERFGQGPAIATNLMLCSGLKTPIFSVILGEGGSGGALGIAVADWVAMFENAIYVICPPERCAEILWRDAEKKELAASAMKVSASDLLALGVIDTVLPEPGGGAHRNPDGAAAALETEIAQFLEKCHNGAWSLEERQEKLRRMGRWIDGEGVPLDLTHPAPQDDSEASPEDTGETEQPEEAGTDGENN